jgi:hypothetical protein
MGAPSRDEEEAKKMEAGGDTVGQKLDAGALFVLQSKGALSLHRLKLTTPAGRSSSPCSSIFLFWSTLAGRAPSVLGAEHQYHIIMVRGLIDADLQYTTVCLGLLIYSSI